MGAGGEGLDRAEGSSVLNRFSAQIPGAPAPGGICPSR